MTGAVQCEVTWPDGRAERDENGFATALVVRRRRRAGIRPPAGALDYLQSCAAAPPGAFRFWPPAATPVWARDVPADVDDTAVITLELWAHGRLTRDQALDTVFDVLMPTLTGAPPACGPPWIRPGVFGTWVAVDGTARPPVVDCGVNANVVALLAALDRADLPGYAAAVEMITAAVAWCAAGPREERDRRLDSIAPYYAHPAAVADVLADAVWCGAAGLAPALGQLDELLVGAGGDRSALCRNAYSGPVWRCRALDAATRRRPFALVGPAVLIESA
jgi:hypothetical protein